MIFRLITFFIFFFTTIFSQQHIGIHQKQLEYYNNIYKPTHRSNDLDIIRPITHRERNPSHEVFGYHPYWMGTAWTNYNFDLISTLAYFSAEATGTGDLENLHGWPVTSLINEAHDHGTEVVLCVTLFSNSELVELLSNSVHRQNLINNLLVQVQIGNADGVNVDFESFPASQKENMVTFITDLTNIFHQEIPGSQVTLAMPAVDWNAAWDYEALASISDGLFIMGYGYHWSGSSTTGPNSPLTGSGYTITWTVIDYLNKTNFQSEKLILGCPYYGFVWPSTSGIPGTATTGSGESQFYTEMEGSALSFGKTWHESSQTPWYSYENNGWYQGWYDDSLSLSLKYDFALYNDLKGIGIWALGYDGNNTELWDLLYAKFGDAAPPTTPGRVSMKNTGNGSIMIDFQGAETASEFIVLRSYLEVVGGFDTLGLYSNRPIVIGDLTEGETYFLSIAAVNSFGSSEPTEMLGIIPSSNPVSCLIINGFDRVNGTNNTFDFIRQHGSAIQSQGYAFDSATNEAVIQNDIEILDYQFVDWILGEEGTATSSFTGSEQNIVKAYLENGRFLFVSGSEIGYDLAAQGNTSDDQFYRNYLKAEYISDAAGEVYIGDGTYNSTFHDISDITFDNGTHGTYDVDWPDGIKPVGGASICMKYDEVDYDSRGGMGIEYLGSFGSSNDIGGLVYMAVGFEAIYPETKRNELMTAVLNIYESQLNTTNESSMISPSILSLHALYPNPTNTYVTLEFSSTIPNDKIIITARDVLGRTIIQASLAATGHPQTWTWDGKNNLGQALPTGLYILSIHNDTQIHSKKITLLK